MAKGAAKSGLSVWIGEQLTYFDALPHFAIVLIIVTFAAFLTEVVSNMTTANIFLPVVRDLVSGPHRDDIYNVSRRNIKILGNLYKLTNCYMI